MLPLFSVAFVLKICTDTYKIIDKNIPLLTIRLGGKPRERLRRGAGWAEGGEGLEGLGLGRGEGRGSVATQAWPLLSLPPELPPPVGCGERSSELGTKHSLDCAFSLPERRVFC